MSAELETFCNRILGALLNGGYQGLLLTPLVWLGLRWAPRTNAATRHAVWFATLLVVAALPVVHFLSPHLRTPSLPEGPGKEPPPIAATFPEPSPLDFPSDEAQNTGLGSVLSTPRASHGLAQPSRDASDALRTSGSGPQPADLAGSALRIPEDSLADAATGTTEAMAAGVPMTSAPHSNWRLSLPAGAAVTLIGLWVVLAAVRLGHLGLQCWGLSRLQRKGGSAPEDAHVLFNALCDEMGMTRRPRLMLCAGATAPMAVGLSRPAVLLPARVLHSAEPVQIEQILRHELAHVTRADHWVNLTQQIINAVLFFHPAVRWLSRRMTIDREIACDDHVLAATSAPRSYALFLAEFASRTKHRDWSVAPAGWSNTSQLKERITMILNSQRNTSPRLDRLRTGLLATVASSIALVGLGLAPRIALASEEAVLAPNQPVAKGAQQPGQIQEPQDPIEPEIVSVEVSVLADAQPSAEPLRPPQEAHAPKGQPPAAASGPRPKPGSLPRPGVIEPGAILHPPLPALLDVAEVPPSLPVAPKAVMKPVLQPGAISPGAMLPPAAPGAPAALRAAPAKPSSPKLVQLPPGALQPPRPELAPVPKEHKELSLEHRLERLERIVETLAARQPGAKQYLDDGKATFQFHLNKPSPDHAIDKEKLAKIAEEQAMLGNKLHMFGPAKEQLREIREQAKNTAEQARRQAANASRDAYRVGPEHWHHSAAGSGSIEKQRKALEAQHQSLEKQMRAIEKQLRQLEREQHESERHEREVHEQQKNRAGQGTKELEAEAEASEDAPKRRR